MNKKAPRRRIDVNLKELDDILDRTNSGPLSEAETQKLRVAIHAMADRLEPKRNSEKTKAAFEKPALEASPPTEDSSVSKEEMVAPGGHGRNGAADFIGATRVSIPHATLQPGHTCPDCAAMLAGKCSLRLYPKRPAVRSTTQARSR